MTKQSTLTETLFSFQGRASRQTYWVSFICMMVVVMFISFLLAVTHVSQDTAAFIMVIMMIPVGWIGLAIQIKRWHDRDKSGWWIFIGMVPIIGPLWAFIENGFLEGTVGENRYGHPDN